MKADRGHNRPPASHPSAPSLTGPGSEARLQGDLDAWAAEGLAACFAEQRHSGLRPPALATAGLPETLRVWGR